MRESIISFPQSMQSVSHSIQIDATKLNMGREGSEGGRAKAEKNDNKNSFLSAGPGSQACREQ
jgi:hypothetical protein